MSDSEDDFMSDKFLVDAAAASSSSAKSKTYSEKRHAQSLKSLRSVQANNQLPLAQLEKARRHEGLNTSLFDRIEVERAASNGRDGAEAAGSSSSSKAASGGSKAMEMMMRMGWKKGEGLGRARSPSPDRSAAKKAKVSLGDEDDEEEEAEEPPRRGGIGSSTASSSSKKALFLPSSSAGTDSAPKQRTEPIRVSLWSGRKGLSARTPSPPPLIGRRDPDALDDDKLKRLENETEGFRERQRREFGEKEVERKISRARESLLGFDRDKGVKFHPLHVSPLDPLETLPKPLLKRIYPAQAYSPSPGRDTRSPSPQPLDLHTSSTSRTGYISQAERLRERMRKDMLSDLHGDGELGGGSDKEDDALDRPFGVQDSLKRKRAEGGREDEDGPVLQEDDLDWDSEVQGTKRVLAMDPKQYLDFLVSQLRQEHLYCMWCSYKYGNYEEMDGPGGCPGEDEDDH